MSCSMPRLAVFDLAGTTMQDDGSVASHFLQVLREEGLAGTPEDIAGVRGASKREAFRKLSTDAVQAERLFGAFIASLRQHHVHRPPREVPGASAIFTWLRGEGVKIALNTGFEREMVASLMAALGWSPDTFDAVVCGDEVAAGRPSPLMIQEAMHRTRVTEPASVLIAGDTVLDLQAGAAAQAGWIIGVTSGAHDHARLLHAPHTHLVASIVDIRDVLRFPVAPTAREGMSRQQP